jgi:hypothetical protein
MEKMICQSCGMPMVAPKEFGTDSDGSANGEYCVYCFKNGKFTVEVTMDGMISRYAEFPDALKDENGNSITKGQFVANMKRFLPTLKRWQNR